METKITMSSAFLRFPRIRITPRFIRRNIRDKLRVEIDVRTIITKNTMSVMAKLMVACRCENERGESVAEQRRYDRCHEGLGVVAQAPE